MIQFRLRVFTKFINKYCTFAVLLKLSLAVFPQFANADDYKIVTTNLPPWSIEGTSGVFPDIVTELEDIVGSNNTPDVLPWSRAQIVTKNSDDHIIFPLTRTAGREDSYTWIVDVMPTTLQFITIDGEGVDLEAARRLKVILVHQDAPPSAFLESKGFTNIYKHPNGGAPLARMLIHERGDAWFAPKSFAKYAVRGTEIAGKLVFGPPVTANRIYIAGSKDLDASVVKAYREAFEQIKQDGTVDKIIDKYLGE